MSADNFNNVKHNRKDIIINNFLGGLAWAVGATIGISLLIAILGFIAAHVNVIPVFGKFVSDIIDFVLQNNRSLHR